MNPLFAGVARSRRELAAGASLFRRGDRVQSVYVVEAGQVDLVRTLENGSMLTLASYGEGQLVAEAALFSPTYHCDAVAVTPSHVARLPKAALLEALRADPDAMLDMMARQAHAIQALRTGIELRNLRPLPARVLAWLDLQASDRNGWVSPPGSWKAAAQVLGASHEALYRCLAALEADGALERDGGRVRRRMTAVIRQPKR